MVNKLNIGCGNDYKKGWVNLDYEKHYNPDIVHDLNKYPYPFKNNTFDYIYASHIIEHLDNVVLFMKECQRILKNKGILYIRIPHFSCCYAYSDPTHQHYFMYYSFDFFCNNGNTSFRRKQHNYGNTNFKIIKKKFVWLNKYSYQNNFILNILNSMINNFANKYPNITERVLCYYLGGFNELKIKLEVIK